MKVTLARVPDYAVDELPEDAKPDATVDVDDRLAEQLLNDGHARMPAPDGETDPLAGVDDTAAEPELYDPANYTVDEVIAYLQAADPAERERVLGLEHSAEKPRKGITDWQPAN